jgi:nitroimidazol reductase NimA-like FMN-containing flavoprotein (pyridoxamine 5'-phosphate oxidase superfamily)
MDSPNTALGVGGHPDTLARTERTRLRRYPDRASYDRQAIYAALDEAIVCHMGFVVDDQPFVIPTLCVRVDDELYLHGSAASRALNTMRTIPRACVTATLVDGLVLARSAFFHSVNYRSVVVLGQAKVVDADEEKLLALEQFVNAVVKGRWDEVRPPSKKELKATQILRMPLLEASLKMREGPPKDPEADLTLPAWAGVIPLRLCSLEPEPDPLLCHGIEVPQHVIEYFHAHS